MKNRLIFLLVILFLGVGALFSLVMSDTTLLRREPEPLEISVVVRSADSVVWAAARQGMEQAADDFGVELRFLTLSTANSAREQAELFRHELDGGADGVILVPADPEILAPEVRRAAGRAAVVTIESDMSDSGAAACVSPDNEALGRALAVAAAGSLQPGQSVLLVDGAPGSSGISARLDAARAALLARGHAVNLFLLGDGPGAADELSRRVLSTNAAAVLAFDAVSLELAARALQDAKRPPPLYGTGATPAVVAYLEQGGIAAIAAQNDFAAGYLAVEAAAQAARKRRVSPAPPLAFSIVDRETMHRPENQKLLFPVK